MAEALVLRQPPVAKCKRQAIAELVLVQLVAIEVLAVIDQDNVCAVPRQPPDSF